METFLVVILVLIAFIILLTVFGVFHKNRENAIRERNIQFIRNRTFPTVNEINDNNRDNNNHEDNNIDYATNIENEVETNTPPPKFLILCI